MQAEERPFALIVVLGTLSTVLAILLVRQSLRPADSEGVGVGLRDDARSAKDVAAMVTAMTGPEVWDSHPDADVARVMQPGIAGRVVQGKTISSNLQGMREEAVALPKPEGTVRVVLLGDSFIYGLGVEADERLGVHLQRYLAERSRAEVQHIEVLHFGVSSWNLISECAFVRRQLTLLQPDLVIHLSVRNDLADTMGARGFGATATHVPRLPSRADGALRPGFARWSLDRRAFSTLPLGLDHESRLRFQDAADAVALLARSVIEFGGEYLHVFRWGTLNPVAAERIAPRLTGKQQLYLPRIFVDNPDWRLSSNDEHWNPTGHEQVARLLYGVIVLRGLLSELDLEPWPEVGEWAQEMAQQGRAEALAEGEPSRPTGSPVFDIDRLAPTTASQVHGGIDRDGLLSPYASLMLRNRRALLLVVEGSCLDRPELNTRLITISLDEVVVGRIKLMAQKTVDIRLPVPKQLRLRPFLTVRFVAEDYVYTGDDLRRCVSFRLQRVALMQ